MFGKTTEWARMMCGMYVRQVGGTSIGVFEGGTRLEGCWTAAIGGHDGVVWLKATKATNAADAKREADRFIYDRLRELTNLVAPKAPEAPEPDSVAQSEAPEGWWATAAEEGLAFGYGETREDAIANYKEDWAKVWRHLYAATDKTLPEGAQANEGEVDRGQPKGGAR